MDEDSKGYLMKIFGRIPREYELLDKYLPGFVSGNIKVRRSIYPYPGKDKEASIPRKYRELMMIAIELATGRGGGKGAGGMPGLNHTRWAVREAGVTPKEVAEAVAIAVYLCGQPSVVDYGYHCIEAAEKEQAELLKKGLPG